MRKRDKAQLWEFVVVLVLLTMTLAIVKGTGLVDISLLWVLAPLWIPGGIVVLILLVAIISLTVNMTREMVRKRGRDEQNED